MEVNKQDINNRRRELESTKAKASLEEKTKAKEVVIDHLARGNSVGALVTASQKNIQIPKDHALKAANTIMDSYNKKEYGDYGLMRKKLAIAHKTYKEHGLKEKAKEADKAHNHIARARARAEMAEGYLR